MATIKERAIAYEGKKMKNIADLESVNASLQLKDETRQNKEGEDYE